MFAAGADSLTAGQVVSRLRDELEHLARDTVEPPFDPEGLAFALLMQLARQLLEMLSRVLVLEMHVADQEGRLGNGTERERFLRFGEMLIQPEVRLALLQEYPVMARQVVVRVTQWVESSLQLARALTTDLPLLADLFCDGEHPGKVVGLKADLGDRHRGGRTVMSLQFSSGLRVVFKPRSLGVEARFQDLLGWCNEHLDSRFRVLTVLDRGTHGWMEHVRVQSCHSESEVRQFFGTKGHLLALHEWKGICL